VWVRRQWNDYRRARYRLSDTQGAHWDTVSGGVAATAPQPFIHLYVWCDEMIEGELAHSCRHGAGPHHVKVCVLKGENEPEAYAALLAQAGPKPARTRGRMGRRATAHHEAGHAVIGHQLGRRFQRVSMTPDVHPEGDTLGVCLYEPFPDSFQPDMSVDEAEEELIRTAILTAYAGHLAEELFWEEQGRKRRNNWVGSRHDREGALQLAISVTGGPRETRAYLNDLWIRARALVRAPGASRAIKALARALLARHTLGYDEAAQIIVPAMAAAMAEDAVVRDGAAGATGADLE
jgi:hypothetical protein